MVKCFEANYPESLGTVLVHKAPWIFQGLATLDPTGFCNDDELTHRAQGIWKIIKGWLDPVVASKVHFTNNRKDMEEFIAPGNILKELDGDEDWTYRYVEPVPGENDRMKDSETRDRLLADRERLFTDYEQATIQWIHSPVGEDVGEIKARRNAIATKLRDGYWNLDPYIRARSLYDRTGILRPGGEVNYYPETTTEVPVKTNGASSPAVVQTTADDVD